MGNRVKGEENTWESPKTYGQGGDQVLGIRKENGLFSLVCFEDLDVGNDR